MVSLTGALLTLALARATQASLYITFPVKGSVCTVKQACQIKWMDTSASPSSSTLGETALDLVSGDASNLTIVQALGGVSDPSKATAFTFTPNVTLSPNFQYAVRFTPAANSSWLAFSTYFNITGGNTTVNTPVKATKAVLSSSNATTSTTTNSTSSAHNASSTAAQAGSSSSASFSAVPQQMCILALLMACVTLMMV